MPHLEPGNFHSAPRETAATYILISAIGLGLTSLGVLVLYGLYEIASEMLSNGIW